jgi:hypothetical protein
VIEIIFLSTALLRFSEFRVAGWFTSALQLVNTISGIIGFLFIMNSISRFKCAKKVIFIIADYSWYIYILHPYFTSFSKTILMRVIPGINIYGYFASSLLFTILGCIVVGYFSKKITIIDFMFYPQKYIVDTNKIISHKRKG